MREVALRYVLRQGRRKNDCRSTEASGAELGSNMTGGDVDLIVRGLLLVIAVVGAPDLPRSRKVFDTESISKTASNPPQGGAGRVFEPLPSFTHEGPSVAVSPPPPNHGSTSCGRSHPDRPRLRRFQDIPAN